MSIERGLSGWFCVDRRLLDSQLWLSEPFTRGQAWIDLIGLARFRPGLARIRGLRVDLARGQIARSEGNLGERWKWSRGKVRRFLFELEKDQRIVQQKTRITTLITVLNYDVYQYDGTTNGTTDSTTDGTTDSTTDGTRKNKDNNGNNGNNVKNPPHSPPRGVSRGKFKKPSLAEVQSYCQERDNGIDASDFLDHYEANGWKRGSTPIKDWKACIRTWEARRRKEQPASRVATLADLENFDLVTGREK